MSNQDHFFFVIALFVSFCIPFILLLRVGGISSDEYIHLFLMDSLKQNRRKLFNRVPRLLNESYCGYPLFMHWVLSFLNRDQIKMAITVINPLASTFQIAGIYLFLVLLSAESASNFFPQPGLICLVIALTPQFFHVFNARSIGLSARPIGLLLFQFYFSFIYSTQVAGLGWFPLVAAIICGYLIFGISAFAQQGIIFISLALGLFFGSWLACLVTIASVLLFILLHPSYSLGYLRYKYIHLRNYATDLADVYILRHRYSIWRDWIYDFWIQFRQSKYEGIKYIYTNGLVIIIFLNPLSIISLYSYFRGGGDSNSLLNFCRNITVAAFVVFFITSFRRTRFLGEPERYVELVAPFTTFSAAIYLINRAGQTSLYMILGFFVVIDIMQLFIGQIRARKFTSKNADIDLIKEKSIQEFQSEAVRFGSNNEDLTKFFMDSPEWSFARFWHTNTYYGGYRIREVFDSFPMVRMDIFESMVERFQLNILLIDKTASEKIFADNPQRISKLKLLLDTEKYTLYQVEKNL